MYSLDAHVSEFGTKTEKFVQVASELNKTQDMVYSTDWKQCRDRWDRLLRSHRTNENKARKRSGTVEEVTHLDKLLNDADEEIKARDESTEKERKTNADKEKKMINDEEHARTVAMTRPSRRPAGDVEDQDRSNSDEPAKRQKKLRPPSASGEDDLADTLKTLEESKMKIENRRLDLEEKRIANAADARSAENKRYEAELELWRQQAQQAAEVNASLLKVLSSLTKPGGSSNWVFRVSRAPWL